MIGGKPETRYFVGEDTRVVFLYDENGLMTGYELYPADSEEYAALLAEYKKAMEVDDEHS